MTFEWVVKEEPPRLGDLILLEGEPFRVVPDRAALKHVPYATLEVAESDWVDAERTKMVGWKRL